MISNRVKRNISGAAFVLGIVLMVMRATDVVADFSSRKAWIELIGSGIWAWMVYNTFSIYRKRVKDGTSQKSK